MRKIFIENLPKLKNGNVSWKESIGQKVKFQYDDIQGELKIASYDYNDYSLNVNYLDKGVFKISIAGFKKCMLGKILNKYTNEFKIEIGTCFKDDKRDLIILDREYRKDSKTNIVSKWYKYKCLKCGWDNGWMVESNLLNRKDGCSCCKNKTLVLGINDIATIAPWMVKYFQNPEDAELYTLGNKRIKSKCPICGKIKNETISINSIYKNNSIGCKCKKIKN